MPRPSNKRKLDQGGFSGRSIPTTGQAYPLPKSTRNQNSAAKSYITTDPVRSQAAKKAAETRANNIERETARRENAANARGTKKGRVQGMGLGAAGATAGGALAAESRRSKSPSKPVKRVNTTTAAGVKRASRKK